MISYAVHIQIDQDIVDPWTAWLEKHIHELLALPGFVDARWSVWSPTEHTVVYTLQDQAAMDRYLEEFAPAMRGDGTNRFAGKFQIQRQIGAERRFGAAS